MLWSPAVVTPLEADPLLTHCYRIPGACANGSAMRRQWVGDADVKAELGCSIDRGPARVSAIAPQGCYHGPRSHICSQIMLQILWCAGPAAGRAVLRLARGQACPR